MRWNHMHICQGIPCLYSLQDLTIIYIHVKDYSQTYLSHKYCTYINMFIFKLYYQAIYSNFFILYYSYHLQFMLQTIVGIYIEALAPNTFIINNFYIQSIYFYGTPFIFLPPSPIFMLCFMKIFVIMGMVEYVLMCVYL